jgi:hypothetical protein
VFPVLYSVVLCCVVVLSVLCSALLCASCVVMCCAVLRCDVLCSKCHVFSLFALYVYFQYVLDQPSQCSH